MSNPNNIIRPAVLNNPQSTGSNSSLGSQNPPNLPPTYAELEATITNLVKQLCREQCRNLVGDILNPNTDIAVSDQEIEERYRENLTDLDKVPDIVRCLREFSGNHCEFSSWKKSVERVLNIYQTQKGTPKYFAILNVIRNKIIGAADSALESYNTPLCWEAISRCLTIHYADKRDIGTLEYQLTTLVQGNLSVQEFYQEVYSHLSLIISNINCMTIGREATDVLIQTYRDKALDTFIRGLRGDLAKLLCIREPNSLPQALHLCLKLQNQNFRTDHALNKSHRSLQTIHKNQNFSTPTFGRNFTPIPQTFSAIQKNNQPQYQTYYPNNFPNRSLTQQQYPHYKAFPNSGQFRNHQNQFQKTLPTPPPRPTAPKPLPRPIPMEIDQSIQSRRVNYMNRPSNNDRFSDKRPSELPTFHTQKFQKNYNIITDNDVHEVDYNREMNSYQITEELQPFEEYCDQGAQYEEEDQPEPITEQELSDIHFLE